METRSLDLVFFPGNYDPQKNPMPHGPSAHIFVKTSSSLSRSDKTFSTVITPECVSYIEFEYQIESLIKELESIRSKARALFEKDKKDKEKLFEARKQ